MSEITWDVPSIAGNYVDAAEKNIPIDVVSSMLESFFTYVGIFYVTFKNGDVYAYKNVDMEIVQRLETEAEKAGGSVGKLIYQLVTHKSLAETYPYMKITDAVKEARSNR